MLGSGSAITTSAISTFNPSVDIVLKNRTDLITSIAVLITNEKITKSKIRCTKLRDWIIAITLLYGKTLKQPMVD